MPAPVPVVREGMSGQFARFRRDPLGMFGLILVVVMVLSAVFADVLAAYPPAAIDVKVRLAAPSLDHLIGTDQLGRDVFSRVLYGGRIALQVAFICIGSSLVVGLALGMLAGYGPRWLDNALILVFDAVRSFPTIMLALAIVTLVGPSLETIIAIIIVIQIPGYARITRTQTLSLKTNEFILAERSLGAGMARVLAVHVLPNVIGPLLILASMDVPVVVTIEAGLSFLGQGVRPPTPSWGSILNDGYAFIRNTPWLVVAGGVPLVLTTLGFTFLGEALRDIFDPKLRRE
ncbi:MAG: ABC transporter permease [Alphaproteobacteria bacterium]